MPTWITGNQLLLRWEIASLTLLEFIKKGLKPYTINGKLFLPSHIADKVEMIQNLQYKLAQADMKIRIYSEGKDQKVFFHGKNRTSVKRDLRKQINDAQKGLPDIEKTNFWEDYELPDNGPVADLLLRNFLDSIYSLEDVEEFEKTHKIPFKNVCAIRNTLSNQKDKTDSIYENYFKLNTPDGSYWEVCFQGEKRSLRNLKRLRYIICLLKYPATIINVTRLSSFVEKQRIDDNRAYDKDEVSEFNRMADRLTKAERKNYKKAGQLCYGELIEAEESGGIELKEDKKKALDIFIKQLNKMGLVCKIIDGKFTIINDYGIKDPGFEKLRKNISNQIKKAIEEVNKNFPALGEHFAQTIKTGANCSYNDRNTNWQIITKKI